MGRKLKRSNLNKMKNETEKQRERKISEYSKRERIELKGGEMK